jgi:GNAT superfamily N-acetyltransferase
LRIYQNAAMAAQADALTQLCARVFAQFDAGRLRARLAMQRGWMLVQAETETQRPVAFKLGYEQTDESFYSWLGGVDPDWRGQGLAQRLMHAQHDWAARAGYRSVTTRTQIGNDRMAAINRAAGFVDTGIITKADGRRLRAFAKSLV